MGAEGERGGGAGGGGGARARFEDILQGHAIKLHALQYVLMYQQVTVHVQLKRHR